MSIKINADLTEEEFNTLYGILGEYARITRDQYYRFVETEYTYSFDPVNKKRFEEAQCLLNKLVEENKK